MATFDGTERLLGGRASSSTIDAALQGCLRELAVPGIGGGPPAITITPVAGTLLQPGDAVVVDIIGDNINLAVITVRFDNAANEVLAYRGIPDDDNFEGFFADSTVVPITGGFRFTITRQGGWPSQRIDLTAAASNGGGTQE